MSGRSSRGRARPSRRAQRTCATWADLWGKSMFGHEEAPVVRWQWQACMLRGCMRMIILSGLVCLVAACISTGSGADFVAQARDEIRYYDRETFTVVMTHRGATTGTTTTYVRDWGRRQVIVNEMSFSSGGLAQPYRNRTVMEGGRIVTIDETGAATGETLADYEANWAQWRGRSAMERFESQMPSTSARPTGELGSFAGHACEYWEAPAMGIRDCVTSWALTVYESFTVGNVAAEMVATEVRIGDGGPDAAFAYDPATVTERSAWIEDSHFPRLNCEQTGSVLRCSPVPY